jgi:hypothetical protein
MEERKEHYRKLIKIKDDQIVALTDALMEATLKHFDDPVFLNERINELTAELAATRAEVEHLRKLLENRPPGQ